MNIRDPAQIINKIREIRKSEANLSDSNVKVKLYSLSKYKSEGNMGFYDKFDAICQESEVFEDVVPLSDEEKRSGFEKAIEHTHPNIVILNITQKQINGKNLSIEQMKSYIL